MKTVYKTKIIEHTNYRKFEELLNSELQKYDDNNKMIEVDTHITRYADHENLDVLCYTAIIKFVRFLA